MVQKDSAISHDRWESKGSELFGDDKTAWRFVCPACGNVASIKRAIEEWPELEGRGWNPTSECVGRYTDKIDCDWCAYGLFSGPVFVEVGKDRVAAFDFDGRPFTLDKGEHLDEIRDLSSPRCDQ